MLVKKVQILNSKTSLIKTNRSRNIQAVALEELKSQQLLLIKT